MQAKQSSFTTVVLTMYQTWRIWEQMFKQIFSQNSAYTKFHNSRGIQLEYKFTVRLKFVLILHADLSVRGLYWKIKANLQAHLVLCHRNLTPLKGPGLLLYQIALSNSNKEVYTHANCKTTSARENFAQWETKIHVIPQVLQVRVACLSKFHLIKKGGKDLKWKGGSYLLFQFHEEIFCVVSKTKEYLFRRRAELPLLPGRHDWSQTKVNKHWKLWKYIRKKVWKIEILLGYQKKIWIYH